MTAEWPGRVVGSSYQTRILCGRRVADRYVCQGEVGLVSSAKAEYAVLASLGAAPDTDDVWRLTSYASTRTERGERPRFRRPPEVGFRGSLLDEARNLDGRLPVIEWPFRAECPHCHCIVVTTLDVLTSQKR